MFIKIEKQTARVGAPSIKRCRFLRCSFIRLSDKKANEYGKYAKSFFSLIRIK